MKVAEDYTDELMEEMTTLQDQIDAQNLWDLDSQVDVAMEALRCPPDDASVDTLSGGEKRRVALCKLLLEAPEILLLDEPTNHLDAETIAWLQKHLIEYRGTILIVTHDRYFLDDITCVDPRARPRPRHPLGGQLLLLARAEGQAPAPGGPRGQGPPADPHPRARMDPPGRQGPPGQAEGPHQRLQRARPKSEREKIATAQIVIPNGPRLGQNVIAVENLEKHYGDRELIDDLTFSLPPGGIVGVIGPNGAGKTTLFRMLTGQEAPDAGTVTFGECVQLSYVDQSRDALNPQKTVWEEISDGLDVIKLGDAEMNSRAYCGAFNFKGGDQQKKVGLLSGGERNRVHLAKLLRTGGNVLLLDEPTNDLDVETLRALEDALTDFAGCAVVISHDRFFLDRICTHMLAFEGDAHVEWFEGNFEDYEADKIRRLGPDAVEPKRIKYKKFAR